MKFRTLLATAALLLSACSSSPEDGVGPDLIEPSGVKPKVTNGVIDTANTFSNVGAMVIDNGGQKRAICSGTLVAPRVFLTASHCTDGFAEAWVSFDVAFGPSSPIH